MNNSQFFISCSLSAIGGTIVGSLFFKTWRKIWTKEIVVNYKELLRQNKPLLQNSKTRENIFWDELSQTKQQELKKSLKYPIRYFYSSGWLSHVIFELHYLQTLLQKFQLNVYDPIKAPISYFDTSVRTWFAKSYQCSVKQIYSQEELVNLFNLSNKEENSLVSRDKSLAQILQDKIKNHD